MYLETNITSHLYLESSETGGNHHSPRSTVDPLKVNFEIRETDQLRNKFIICLDLNFANI